MKPINSIRKLIATLTSMILAASLAGCTALAPSPTPTATASPLPSFTATPAPSSTSTASPTPTTTHTLTPKPSPTKKNTFTPQPSATATPLPPLPTSSLAQRPGAAPMGEACRAVVDGLDDLKAELKFPDHLMEENPLRQAADFDPHRYFQVMTHLSLAPGYVLDYIYFSDELGGKPLVYARRSGAAPFQSYDEFLASYGEETSGERSYAQLGHLYDYLMQIQIDNTPESYLEYITLALLGDQFYLWWHGMYNDTRILCDRDHLAGVDEELAGFELEFPPEVKEQLEQLDFTPQLVVDETTVTVRVVTFTKWGGFFENVYVMDKQDPFQLQDVQFNPLLAYDCGIDF